MMLETLLILASLPGTPSHLFFDLQQVNKSYKIAFMSNVSIGIVMAQAALVVWFNFLLLF